MDSIIFILSLLFFILLFAENRQAILDRKKIKHVIYVNGIRGKSSTTRLIDAGLRAGGYKVFCKTTGTLPMTINTNGEEDLIIRHGKANIKEQLKILHRAAKEGTEILVIECMAVNPELQRISQQKMVRSNIGVITNVRLDHVDEMGNTLEEICSSLCSTIPQNGIVFTADTSYFTQIQEAASMLNTKAYLAAPEASQEPPIDFPENIGIAISVCDYLGVNKDTAISGMRQYQRDPFALSLHVLSGNALFINGFSINDPQSSEKVWRSLIKKYQLQEKKLILLINSRPDRGYRTEHMILLAQWLAPDEIWIMGSFTKAIKRTLNSKLPKTNVIIFTSADHIPFQTLDSSDVVYAVGNLANGGHQVMSRIRKEATILVR